MIEDIRIRIVTDYNGDFFVRSFVEMVYEGEHILYEKEADSKIWTILYDELNMRYQEYLKKYETTRKT